MKSTPQDKTNLDPNLEEELIEIYDDPLTTSSTLEERLCLIKKNIVYGKICNCLSEKFFIKICFTIFCEHHLF